MYTPTRGGGGGGAGAGGQVQTSPNGKGIIRNGAECLCAICNCGLHRCPPPPAAPVRFDGETTHHHDFKDWNVCPVHGPTIAHKAFVSLPFDAQSTYQHDFIPMPLQAPASPAPAPPKHFETKFEGTTEARAQYKEHPLPPPPTTKPSVTPSKRNNEARFEGVSEAMAQFHEHPLQPLHAPAIPVPKQQQIPFEAESEAHARYREFKGQPSDLRWEGKVQPPTQQPRIPFDAISTSQHDFVPWDVKLEKPAASPVKKTPSLPFDAISESNDRYRAWDVQQQAPPSASPSFAKRPDDRDFLSEAHKQFTEKRNEECPAAHLGVPPNPAQQPSAWEGNHVLYDMSAKRYA